jgi:hypothetical protein
MHLGNPRRATGRRIGREPMKTSTNGAVIMSGAGVAAVRRKLEEEFEKARGLVVSSQSRTLPQSPQEPPEPRETIYTEQNKARFCVRAERLSLDALASAHITTSRSGPIEITVPTETAEELFRQAGRGK